MGDIIIVQTVPMKQGMQAEIDMWKWNKYRLMYIRIMPIKKTENNYKQFNPKLLKILLISYLDNRCLIQLYSTGLY